MWHLGLLFTILGALFYIFGSYFDQPRVLKFLSFSLEQIRGDNGVFRSFCGCVNFHYF